MESKTESTSQRRGPSRVLVTLVALVTTLCVGLVTAAPAQAAAPQASAVSAPVTGTVTDDAGKVTGTVTGLLNVTKFKKKHGDLFAKGRFVGTITQDNGAVIKVKKTIAMPLATAAVKGAPAPSVAQKDAGVANQLAPKAQKKLAAAAAAAPAVPAPTQLSCQVLDLVLGPLTLDLLGLVVHLDTVHLNITAVPGAGNLLGNLLCAVAGLLDGSTGLNGILNGITSLLNRLLGVLG